MEDSFAFTGPSSFHGATWQSRLSDCKKKRLNELNLSRIPPHKLPKRLKIPSHVDTIYFEHSEIVEIPKLLKGHNNIRYVSITNSSIEIIPPWFCNSKHYLAVNFTENQISSIPSEIGNLSNLEHLFLGLNKISSLPEEFGELQSLNGLYLHVNKLSHIPEAVSKLAKLDTLTVSDNEISEIPAFISKLKSLKRLGIRDCSIKTVSPEIGKLKNLTSLELGGNKIGNLPDEIGDIKNLTSLELAQNRLETLPRTISNLKRLEYISIQNNPLPEAVFDSLGSGNVNSLQAFLASLFGDTRGLFEAKLLVTGEGKVGKSWALSALSGKNPEAAIGDDNTTWGIDRGIIEIDHPNFEGEKISFNTWDFGGQRIYRVTHQFFFSEQAVYLLVWNPRAGAEQCRVHEWLRTIALRTGMRFYRTADDELESKPRAKVIMVATHAKDKGGNYNPNYGYDSLADDLKSMIVDEIEIDSRVGYNIDELRNLIALHAAELPEMGQPLNEKWDSARNETLSLKSQKPKISFSEFSEICLRHGVESTEQQRALAWIYLHSLGRAIWYGRQNIDEENRGDFLLAETIILDAVWLSRAFVQVLEDEKTIASGGMLDHSRLGDIWTNHQRPEWHKYGVEEYELLKQVMRRFDVALPTRESDGKRSLVPQLVPYSSPVDLPWSKVDGAPGPRTISMRCELGFEAIGLMPRLIAATEPWHVYENGRGLFWEKGVFLRDTASFKNEAMIALSGVDRPRLNIIVSGDRPDFLMHEIYRTIEAVLSFWRGMTRTYLIGCPSVSDELGRCGGLFRYDAIVRRIKDGSAQDFNCQVCDRDLALESLIRGFEPLVFDKHYMLQHLYHRDQILAPRICLLEPADKSLLRVTSWAKFVGKRFKITLISELSGKPVSTQEFSLTKAWVKWLRPVTRVTSLALTGAAVPLGEDAEIALGAQSDLLNQLGSLPEDDLPGYEVTRKAIATSEADPRDIRLTNDEIANFARFLAAIDLDPRSKGMDIAAAPDGRWLWMSPEEVSIYKPQPAVM